MYLDVQPVAGAATLDCFPVVERRVQEQGGEICYGWRIWEWPEVMLEAEFHAVWKDAEGHLHDITPLPAVANANRSLFIPDPIRRYQSRQVNNVRWALTDRSEIHAFMAATDAEFELLNRGDRADQHGEIVLTGDEAQEMHEIRARKARALATLSGQPLPSSGQPVRARRKVGRNERCFCGSGKKFKKCHGA